MGMIYAMRMLIVPMNKLICCKNMHTTKHRVPFVEVGRLGRLGSREFTCDLALYIHTFSGIDRP